MMGIMSAKSMKKMVASNKLCTCMIMTAMGSMIGMLAAKYLITNCCCAEKLKCKAKKAFRAMEEKIMEQ